MTSRMTPSEYVAGLREMADFFEAKPDLVPVWSPLIINVFAEDRDEFTSMSRQLGGHRTKGADDNFFEVKRTFGHHTVSVNISRELVCERKVVGTRIVPAQPEATEEIFEWVCNDPVLALSLPSRDGYALNDPKLIELDRVRDRGWSA